MRVRCPVYRQVATVAQATVAADVDEPPYIFVVFPAQVTFRDVILVDNDADAVELILIQIAHTGRHFHIEISLADYLDGFGRADSVDAAQRDVGALAVWNVNSGDTNHGDTPRY